MLFNVWALIWPNQKKVLGIVPASDEEKAKARKTATIASRINFVLSIPMLLCMGRQRTVCLSETGTAQSRLIPKIQLGTRLRRISHYKGLSGFVSRWPHSRTT